VPCQTRPSLLTVNKDLSRGTLKISTEISSRRIGQAVRVLRKALGYDTHLAFAQFLGVREREVGRWEAGDYPPRGNMMLQLLALCPDEETYSNFFVDIGESGSKIASTSQPEVPIEEAKKGARPGALNRRGRVIPKHYRRGPNRK